MEVSTPPSVAASRVLILLLTSGRCACWLLMELVRGVAATGGISKRHTVSYSGAVTYGDAFSGATRSMQSACVSDANLTFQPQRPRHQRTMLRDSRCRAPGQPTPSPFRSNGRNALALGQSCAHIDTWHLRSPCGCGGGVPAQHTTEPSCGPPLGPPRAG